MIKLLVGDKTCFTANFETSLDDSLIHNASVGLESCVLSERLATAQGRVLATPGAAQSTSQVKKGANVYRWETCAKTHIRRLLVIYCGFALGFKMNI